MRTWNKFISEITDAQFVEILNDYRQFEKNSCIGDCLLREKAEEWGREINNDHVVLVMRDLAFEGYRRFGEMYLEKNIKFIEKKD